MTTFKDLFSHQSTDYARFRPTYPPALFAWVAAQTPQRHVAVDVGAGNGQASVALAAHFDRVIGIEPSDGQRANAAARDNVEYRPGAAEATGLEAASADLVASAQAFHWFKHAAFFDEVRRVVRPGGCLAVWCYGLTRITPEIDAIVYEYYENYLGQYWEPERKLVEQGYRTVDVPFPELPAPAFDMQLTWTFAHLIGYLGTWSPLERYIQARGDNPLEIVLPRLQKAWGPVEERSLDWPLSLRAFRL